MEATDGTVRQLVGAAQPIRPCGNPTGSFEAPAPGDPAPKFRVLILYISYPGGRSHHRIQRRVKRILGAFAGIRAVVPQRISQADQAMAIPA